MKRKFALAFLVASLLVLALAVTVMAQGAGPGPGTGLQAADGTCLSGDFVDEDGDGVCDNAGTGMQAGAANRWNGDTDTGYGRQGMMSARRSMGDARGMTSGQGMMGQDYADADGDGVCDHFVDEDGDGVCDNCPSGIGTGTGAGGQQGMARQGMQGRGRWSHGQ